MEAIVRAHAFVSGKVQGVGFRAFVQKQANKMALHGWVR
ncbi:MAG: acylphosphatase, partial [Nitrospira sp.]|nr:acylphosphatase [Nitrospira sp.]